MRTVTGERLRAALPFCFGGTLGDKMERKRVAGRFVAEDKGGVAKKRAAVPRAKEGNVAQEPVPVRQDGLEQNDVLKTAKPRDKGLLGSLLERLKKSPKG